MIMAHEDFETALLKRLDTIVRLLLEASNASLEKTTDKVHWLYDQGFTSSEISQILNARPNSVSGIIAKKKQKDLSKGGGNNG